MHSNTHFSAVADCIVSPDGDMPPLNNCVVAQIDEMLRHVHPTERAQILQVLSLLENALAGFVLDGRFQTFTALSREARVTVLRDGGQAACPSNNRRLLPSMGCVSLRTGDIRGLCIYGIFRSA